MKVSLVLTSLLIASAQCAPIIRAQSRQDIHDTATGGLDIRGRQAARGGGVGEGGEGGGGASSGSPGTATS
jgi:hypothetical protein